MALRLVFLEAIGPADACANRLGNIDILVVGVGRRRDILRLYGLEQVPPASIGASSIAVANRVRNIPRHCIPGTHIFQD